MITTPLLIQCPSTLKQVNILRGLKVEDLFELFEKDPNGNRGVLNDIRKRDRISKSHSGGCRPKDIKQRLAELEVHCCGSQSVRRHPLLSYY